MAEEPTQDEFVWVRNPNLPEDQPFGGPVPRESLEPGGALEGWEEVDPALVAATRVLGRQVTDIASLDEKELAVLARRSGITVDEKTSDKTLRKDVAKALSAEQTETAEVNA